MIQSHEIIRQAIDAKTIVGRMYLVTGVPFKSLVSTFEGTKNLMIIVADGEGSIHNLVEKVTRRISPSHLSPRLIEAMESVQNCDQDSDVRGAQLAFWRVFSETIEHVLLVGDANWIEPILRFCYADPIERIEPAALLNGKGRALLTRPIGLLESHKIDLSNSAAQSIRALLSKDSTVDRIVNLVGGDLGRFERMLEETSESALHLNFYRYLSRSEEEKVLLDILAIHSANIQPNLLYKCASFLSQTENFTIALKGLIDANLVVRRIREGQVTIVLTDEELGNDILSNMENDLRTHIHFHLAQCAVSDRYPAAIVCDHFFQAQNLLALTFVEDAIHELAAQGQLEKSLRYYENWIALESDGQRLKQARFGLVQTLEKLGRYEEAYTHFDNQDEDDLPTLRLKASLLNRLGRFDEVIQILENDVSTEALFVRSEAYFSLGLHAQILEDLSPLLECERDDQESELDHLRKLSKARNAISKVHIVNARFELATAFLEENLALARTWGWKKEIAQAKTYLGIVALRTEQDARAKILFEEALSYSYNANDHFPRACLLNMAILSQRARRFDEALRVGFDAMRDAKRVGDIRVYANAARNVATVYHDLGAFKKAKHILKNLESEEKEDSLGGAWNLFISATVFQDAGDLDLALSFYSRLEGHRLASNFEPILSIQKSRLQVSLGLESKHKTSSSDSDLVRGFEELRNAEAASDPSLMIESGRRAATLLWSVKKESASLHANLRVLIGLRNLGKLKEACAELADVFEKIQKLGVGVPQEYQAMFFQKVIFQKFVSEAKILNVEAPQYLVIQPVIIEQPFERNRFSKFIGEDPSLHRVFRLIDKVAPSDATVLIYGESGTGKELVAEALHTESRRASGPFIKVNCAALVEDLLLSELFGHEKGAFTGAIQQKIGRFELADGGTIFLDEIGDISANTQVSLLRILQEGSFEKVGGTTTQHVNVRVVAATNKDLEKLVEQGTFRLDLYFRLKGVVIETPSLRNRRQDIGRLAAHFIANMDSSTSISPAVVQTLSRYSWPGNIRELQNFMQSILLFVDGSVIERRHIEEFKDFFISGFFDHSLADVDTNYLSVRNQKKLPTPQKIIKEDQLEEAIVQRVIEQGESLAQLKKRLELECIRAALKQTKGNVTQAANILQMKRPRLSQIIGENPDLIALKTRLTA